MQRLKIILQSKLFTTFSVLFLIGYVFLFTKIIHYQSVYKNNTSELEGILLDYDIDGDKLGFTLKAKEKIKVTYYFKNIEEKEWYQKNFKLGQKVRVNGVLNSPSNSTIPNTFNYKNYLYNKKIYWLLSAEKIELLNHNISIFYKIKNVFIEKVNSYKNTSSYMYAFILGDNSSIDSEVYANFRNNGVTHLFAVSGMHIGFFVMAIATLLKKIKVKESIVEIITVLFLIFYMFLVGFSASVVRASLFYILLLLNKKLPIHFKSVVLLYYLLEILLIINPFYIYDIGFIYSFLTSFGLILFSKKITGNYFVKLFKTSFIAFLFSLPVTLYHFYEFNLMTVLNNLIIVPLVSVVLFPLTLITFLFPFLEFLLSGGFHLLEIINHCLNQFSIPIVVAKVSFPFIFLYYFIIYISYRFKMHYIVFIIILLFVSKSFNYMDSHSYVYYLDVG